MKRGLKSVVKFKLTSSSDKNNGYFRWNPTYKYDHISLISS